MIAIGQIFTYSGPQASNSPFWAVKLSPFLYFVLLFKVESEKGEYWLCTVQEYRATNGRGI